MDEICKSLGLGESSVVCVNWLGHAVQHCFGVLKNNQYEELPIWLTIKNFLFSKIETSVVGFNIPINVNPANLTNDHCQELFMIIVHDYIFKISRYIEEKNLNELIFQVIRIFLGVLIHAIIVMLLYVVYKKFKNSRKTINHNKNEPVKKLNIIESIFNPEIFKRAIARQNSRIARNELKPSEVDHPIVQTKKLLLPDGQPLLLVHVKTKLDQLDNVIENIMHDISRLHSQKMERDKENETELKVVSFSQMLGFLNKYQFKLSLLVLCNESGLDEFQWINLSQGS